MEQPLKAHEVKQMLRCSLSEVYVLFHKGELPGYRVGRCICFDPQGVEDFKARNANRPPAAPALPPEPAPRPRKKASPASFPRPFRHLR